MMRLIRGLVLIGPLRRRRAAPGRGTSYGASAGAPGRCLAPVAQADRQRLAAQGALDRTAVAIEESHAGEACRPVACAVLARGDVDGCAAVERVEVEADLLPGLATADQSPALQDQS